MSDYLWRVQIVEYPKGALTNDDRDSDLLVIDPLWRPKGWKPTPEWIERFGKDTGDRFFWPSTAKPFRSRSTAKKRKELIESFGATAIVQRSSRILWPVDGLEVRFEDVE